MAASRSDRMRAAWTGLLGSSAIIGFVASVLQILQIITQRDFSTLLLAVGALAFIFVLAVFLDRRRRVGDTKPAKRSALLEKVFLVLASLSIAGMTIAVVVSLLTAPNGARVEIFQPSVGATMQPGQDVTVEGSVAGLAGDALWVVVKPDAGGRYYLTQGSPVADHDGRWRTVALQVGDDSDRGRNIVFLVLQANRSCSERLEVVPEQDGTQSFTLIPDGCFVRADRAVAVPR